MICPTLAAIYRLTVKCGKLEVKMFADRVGNDYICERAKLYLFLFAKPPVFLGLFSVVLALLYMQKHPRGMLLSKSNKATTSKEGFIYLCYLPFCLIFVFCSATASSHAAPLMPFPPTFCCGLSHW